MLDARKKVQQAMAARNERSDQVVLANVAQAIAWDAMRAPLESLQRQATAHFDEDRVGHGKVFALSNAVLLQTSKGARPKAFQSVVTFAKRGGLPGKLGAAAKEFGSAWESYLSAAAGAEGAASALSAAVAAVGLARRQGIVVMRETEGTLRTKYAETPKEWRKFFRTKAKAKAKREAAPSAPALRVTDT